MKRVYQNFEDEISLRRVGCKDVKILIRIKDVIKTIR